MSLRDWLSDGRLRRHQTSPTEIADLFRVVDRDLADAGVPGLSSDRRFATAYNAALQLATIVVRAAGYRPSGVGHHWMTFQLLLDILGPGEQDRVDYLDSCRQKRNVAAYDRAGLVSESEVSELLHEVRGFRSAVVAWLRRGHPELPGGRE